MPNEFEDRAREAKCQKLAARIVSAVIYTVEKTYGPEQWKEAAKNAGVGMPSEESVKRVVEILRSLRPVRMEGWEL